MGVYEKLLAVQSELKAPKSQYNQFGKYNYRNAEDILEAVKPLCASNKAVIYLTDRPIYMDGRFYIEATAVFQDVETDGNVAVTAYAREDESKKGMDGSQVTGAASSYARKYALNGLLCVDDNKDADGFPPGNDDSPNCGKIKKDRRPQSGEFQRVEPLGPICDQCGQEIRPIAKDGQVVMGVDEVIERSKAKYGFALCYECAMKQAKNEGA